MKPNLKDLQKAKLLQARIIISGRFQQEIHLRKLISAFATPSLHHARLLFDQIPHPSTYIYNIMFRANASSSDPHQALMLYRKMHRQGNIPDNYTFPFLLKACSGIGNVRDGEEIHCQAFKNGFCSDLFVQNSLIHLYGSNSRIEMAKCVSDEMGYRDVATWTTLITCYASFHSIEFARQLFDEMPERNVVSYSAMLAGYVRRNLYTEALELFEKMLRAKVEPNDSAIMSVISACANLGALDKGNWIYSYMCKKRVGDFDSRIATGMIDMFFKCGSIKNALKVFQKAEVKNVGEWTALLSGLSVHGLGKQVIEAFEDMVGSGVKPNAVTFTALLSGCSHSGLVNEGLTYFDRMRNEFGIKPSIEHFGCVVDLLGRSGMVEEAVKFIQDMPIEPNAAIWGALFSACKIHKNIKVGEVAARWLIADEPHNGALYVALMGLYKDGGKSDEVTKVKGLMKDIGCRKIPGCSSIEVNGMCHEFVMGDQRYPYILELCIHLRHIIMEYDKSGNFADLEEDIACILGHT